MIELKEQIKTVVKTGHFTLTSGKESDFYIDIKSLLLKPEFLKPMAKEMYDVIMKFEKKHNIEISAVGGMELGSIPISTAVCLTSEHFVYNHIFFLNQFIIRKTKREHGTRNQIEGLDNIKGKNVVLVDDVLTLGGSIIKAYDAVKDYANVKLIIVIVDREESSITSVDGIPVITLFKKKDLI